MSSSYFSFITNIMTEEVQGYIVMAVALIILIFFLIRIIGERGQQSAECKKMNSLYPSLINTIRAINDTDPSCRKNLCDYYIKTAYNACSGGNYKDDYVDVCNLIAVIRQGVRCLDFEIYSIDDKPVVATSASNNFHVKETYDSVAFSTVMDTINNYAFASGTCPNYTDPLIIHLRIKSSNQKMYSNMARVFQSYSYKMLGGSFSYDASSNNLANTPILSLKNKIVLIVDKSNDDFMDNVQFREFVNMASNSMNMRAYEYKDVQYNTTNDTNELKQFNTNKMTIVFPNKGSNPDNPDAKICRDAGCQMVAMRFQKDDKQLQDSNLFFSRAGYAFALK